MWSCRAAAARTRPLPSSFLGLLGRSMGVRCVTADFEVTDDVLLFLLQFLPNMARYGAEGGDVSAERGDAVRQSSSFPGSDVNKGAPQTARLTHRGHFCG